MCFDIKQMKASSGGEPDSWMFYHASYILSWLTVYPAEISLGGKSSREHACDGLILSPFLFLVQLDMQI